MRRDSRDISATRIAVTLGAIVAVVMLGVWGVAALAGTMNRGLEPGPTSATPVASKSATLSAEPTAAVEATVAPAKPDPAPIPPAKPVTKPAPKPSKPAASSSGFVVVIDPGHQGKGDPRPEPIGPGSSETKARNTSGASGRVTGLDESQLNLYVSLKIRDILQSRGVKVVMCRTTQNVTISNGERARMANSAKADLFLRVHADDVTNTSEHGFMTMVPAANKWWGGTRLAESEKAGRMVQRASIAATGAKDRGITHRGDMSGFNWATVPSVLVEMGFMSNADEDRRMATDAYQRKLATGISNGVMEYLESTR